MLSRYLLHNEKFGSRLKLSPWHCHNAGAGPGKLGKLFHGTDVLMSPCPWSSQSVGLGHHHFSSGVMFSAGAALLARVSLELEVRKLDGSQWGAEPTENKYRRLGWETTWAHGGMGHGWRAWKETSRDRRLKIWSKMKVSKLCLAGQT